MRQKRGFDVHMGDTCLDYTLPGPIQEAQTLKKMEIINAHAQALV